MPFLPLSSETFFSQALHLCNFVLPLFQSHLEGVQAIEGLPVLVVEESILLCLFDQPDNFLIDLGGLIDVLLHALFALEVGHA